MKFVITRTSSFPMGGKRTKTPPCPEAFEGILPWWDYRYYKSPEEFAKHSGRDWFGDGTSEHGYILGPRGGIHGIKRRLPEDQEVWFIELGSLDELVAFSKRYGPLVLQEGPDGCDIMEIEIYDNYRE